MASNFGSLPIAPFIVKIAAELGEEHPVQTRFGPRIVEGKEQLAPGAATRTGRGAHACYGIIGRDGWLARSVWTQGTIICSVPGLTTASRLDVHFWWNVIEMSLLAVSGHVFLRRQRGS